ncbi:hypothetical protein [Hyphomonas chukchiensis]|uniref:Glycosyltransferase RgtA/B/C/D-like domain-containing protein n=1 Tax=Hyphomonas chukchiensis TaxID=1280947 RepID=A0A062UGQ4_9PROT|nr:hypothetical protein [Hyphomonas chukchiensis]KCZ56893.1 hypothetical protein HY30_18145 [Hyphomonas chukchiensis]
MKFNQLRHAVGDEGILRSRNVRTIILIGGAFMLLELCSLIWISVFDWWSIEPLARRGLGFPLAALGYGVIFWAICAFFCIYFLKLERVGRRLFLLFGSLFLAALLLGWPGFYMSDSFAAVEQGRHFPIDTWLGPYTAIITQSVLQHIPFLGALAFFQVSFYALGLAYAGQVLMRGRGGRVGAVVLVVLVLINVPSVFTALLVTRDSWFAILSVFLVTECIVFMREREWRRSGVLLRLVVLGMLAYLLRSDGLIYLAVIVFGIGFRLLVEALRAHASARNIALDGLAVGARVLSPVLGIFLVANILTVVFLPSYFSAAEYRITMWLNPVGYIINHAEQPLSDADLEPIGAVIPISLIRDVGDDTGVNAFWEAKETGQLNPPMTPNGTSRVSSAALDLIQSHPGLWLENRVAVFKAANFGRTEGDQVYPRQAFANSVYSQNEIARWARPVRYEGIWPDGRRAVEQFMLASTQHSLLRLQWAFWPEILLCLGIMLVCWRHAGLGFAGAVLLSRVPVLFVFAPEGQYKYYAAIDMAAPILLAAAIPLVIAMLKKPGRSHQASST